MFFKKHIKPSLLSDLELINLIKSKSDKNAFGEIYIRYAHLVLGTCLKYLKNETDAQDITSKIFEDLTDKIKKHEINMFKNWLYQVTKNECFMFIRKNKAFYIETLDSNFTINNEQHALLKEEKEKQYDILEREITKLNKDQKICVELFYLSDKTYQEICQLTNFNLKEVKSHIQNGKRNLKILLNKYEEFK